MNFQAHDLKKQLAAKTDELKKVAEERDIAQAMYKVYIYIYI